MDEKLFFMILAGLYVSVFVTGGWLVIQNERRQLWRNRITAVVTTAGMRLRMQSASIQNGSANAWSALRSVAHSCYSRARRRKGTAAITILLLVFPILTALMLSSHSPLEGYGDNADPSAPVIGALLRGEHLAPPPPLPPDVFLTKDLQLQRPEIAGASREWALLESDFRNRLLSVYQKMANHGYQMALIEGYRSPERQADLARLGPQITNAGAYQSYHQYGLAADSAFYRDGKVIISEKDAWAMEGYRLYGEYAESVGLRWGGRWKMMDFGHVELRKSGMLARQ